MELIRLCVVYEDADREPMPRLLCTFSWREVRSYFEAEAPKALRKRIRTAGS